MLQADWQVTRTAKGLEEYMEGFKFGGTGIYNFKNGSSALVVYQDLPDGVDAWSGIYEADAIPLNFTLYYYDGRNIADDINLASYAPNRLDERL